ncbi:MAG: hypothetical protein ACYCOO_11885, partial [Chitinophagaceae bacterium]
ANLKHFNVEQYPKEVVSPAQELLTNLGGEMKTSTLKSALGNHYELFHDLMEIKNERGSIQAKLPFYMDIQ